MTTIYLSTVKKRWKSYPVSFLVYTHEVARENRKGDTTQENRKFFYRFFVEKTSFFKTFFQVRRRVGVLSASYGYVIGLHAVYSITLDYLNTVIGLAEVPGTDRYFIIWTGLWDPYKNGSWQWLDGSKVDYTNWAIGQPGTSEYDDCAYFDFYTYQ